ncbi:MAG: hypothetical protein IJB90_03940 [Clostridia bacterium]|nr:hypothetical protein [Clostridia bacterium]
MQFFCGITPQYLGTVESGENCLSVEKIIFLSQKANISTDYILLGKESIIDTELIESVTNLNESQLETSFNILKQILDLLNKECN